MGNSDDHPLPRKADQRLELRTGGRRGTDAFAEDALFEGVSQRRIVAYLLDVVFLAIIGAAAWVAFSILGVLSFGLLTPLGVVAMALLPLAYHTFFLAYQSATPGVRLLGLEVRSLNGARLDAVQAFVMTVLFYVTVYATAWLVLAVALFNERRRTLHDILSGTLVVRAT